MRDIQRDKSIRNVPLTVNLRRMNTGNRPPPPEEYDDYENDEGGQPPPRRVKVPRKRRFRLVWLSVAALVVCAIAGVLLSTIFEGAEVILTPKTVVITDKKEVSAQPEAIGGTLVYKTITASQSASTTLTANGTQHVSRIAAGQVEISNSYSTAPQELAVNTRLASTDGKIFRLTIAVTVPGSSGQGTAIIPGKVTVAVKADAPGAAYNIKDGSPLSIVGFKGDPKYTKIIAAAKGGITGGLVGDEPAVAPADEATAQNELKRQLDSSIRSIATLQIPSDYVGVNGSLTITYTDITQEAGANNAVTLTQGVTATLAMVKVADLAGALAGIVVKDYSKEPVSLGDLSKTVVSLSSTSGTTGQLSLAITGTPIIVWQIDPDSVKNALLGKNKSDFPSIIKSFEPSVAKAQASIRPFWKATFPTDQKKFKVEVSQ